jgi:hypothetical protein
MNTGQTVFNQRIPGMRKSMPRRRVTYFGAETNRRLKFLTNNFVLPAILRKRLVLGAGLYQIQQILSFTLFEKTPILQALERPTPRRI